MTPNSSDGLDEIRDQQSTYFIEYSDSDFLDGRKGQSANRAVGTFGWGMLGLVASRGPVFVASPPPLKFSEHQE